MNRSKPKEMAREGVKCVSDKGDLQRLRGEGKPGTFGELKCVHCGWNRNNQGRR